MRGTQPNAGDHLLRLLECDHCVGLALQSAVAYVPPTAVDKHTLRGWWMPYCAVLQHGRPLARFDRAVLAGNTVVPFFFKIIDGWVIKWRLRVAAVGRVARPTSTVALRSCCS
jgi:hypothetical protein